ncbi:unnamed protein product, partial [Meganyctiphanes norvegica]
HSELDYDVKHPIIIPHGHIALLLVRFQHVYLNHAGVDTVVTSLRNHFWIIGVRRLAKTVCKYCISCQRQDSRACNEVGAPLPGDRVKRAPPFAITGVDFAGPLFCNDFPSKNSIFFCLLVQ